jgi:V/A-type H+-transporting ATPase subunit I
MAVVKMLALTLIGPKAEMETVARLMVLTGGFQPLPLDLLLKDRSVRSRISTASDNPYDDLLVKLAGVWQAAGERVPDPLPVPITPDFGLDRATKAVEQTVHRLAIWAARREDLMEEREQLEAARILTASLSERAMRLADLAETNYLVPLFGKLTDENYRRLEEATLEAPLLLEPLLSSHGLTWFLGLTAPGYREGAKKLLDSLYFKGFSLKEMASSLQGDPDRILPLRIENHKRAIEGLKKAASDVLKADRESMERLYASIYTMQRVYDLCRGRGELSGLYLLSGWIPEDTLQRTRAVLEKEAPGTAVHIEEIGEMPYSGIRVPTLLRNLPLVRAFQDVVSLYSLPTYGEMDPSFFVAVSFCLFFGFMFGDVGHGLVLIAAAALLQKKKVMSRSMATVLKSAGTASVIFGFLYGSVFGVEDWIPTLWISPMEDMNRLLGVSIGVGVTVITLGMILNMIACYRARDFGRLLFDGRGLAGVILYLSMAAFGYATLTGQPMPFPSWVPWTFLSALLAVILLRDILARLLLRQRTHEEGGLYAFEVLHNLLNFLSNTASFVRLAAFALNHVGLSLAVMMLSDMVRNLPGGIVLKGILLLAGNAVIVGLEGLIVFIQTLRLEYYEFFSKFYRGGGRAFRPVSFSGARVQSKTGPVRNQVSTKGGFAS